MRRADRFAKMTALAALDAWTRAAHACSDIPLDRVGLIVATGFGPHPRGFKFLDGILDCGDAAALPTDFSHSVHNAAASYVSELLALRGPTLTITDFEVAFEHAVQLAQCWLADGFCDRVLVGVAEELGDVMLHCAARMTDRAITPGEGAAFFVLARPDIPGIATLDVRTHAARGVANPAAPTPPFGHAATQAAFNLLANLLDHPIAIDNPALLPTSSPRAALVLHKR
jgi:3-oxoacyl-[acyl-carrier-protein] synthase II